MLAASLFELSPAGEITFWNIAVSLAVSSSCALIGCYLVLRRMSLLGDAISHAVLPGLVIGFMISGSRDLTPMLIGAVAAGLLTAYLTEVLFRRARIDADASMGVVFTTLFSIGVILITLYHSQVDLDPGCVLYGQLEASAIDTRPLFGVELPRQLPPLLVVLAAVVLFLVAFWKELKITSFDPAMATTLGMSAGVIHYLLMTMVACTTVACFEAVGSILVIAMLIVPGATAHLLTDRLGPFVVTALVVSWIAAVGGYLGADALDLNAAGSITVALGIVFFVVAIAAPKHGIAVRWLRTALLSLRIAQEDILARLYRYQEREYDPAHAPTEASGGPKVAPAIRFLATRTLLWSRWLQRQGGVVQLTERGTNRARELIRSHRVWESYARENLDLPLDHLHASAHRVEHFITPELASEIREGLADPERDPHGREIP
ncbi:MAG: metal ABC transporter permease [Planctomycetota bacterium]